MPHDIDGALTRLSADGFIRREGARYRTTRRWQGAMARAAIRLVAIHDPGDDLRIPIAHALLETYGNELSDAELAALVSAILPIEIDELSPRLVV